MNYEQFTKINRSLVEGTCPFCDKVYIQRKRVWTHLTNHHPKEAEKYTDALLQWSDNQ